MIKVLHIVPFLDSGGIENLLLSYYKNMSREEIRFDFIVHGEFIGSLELDFKQMNSKVYHIPTKRQDMKKNLSLMKKVISNGNYDVVHSHQGIVSVFPMYYAKKFNVKKRITHSHTTSAENNKLQKIMNLLFSPFLKRYTTDFFACGVDAGNYLWGKRIVENNKLFVMKNSIDLKKFIFNRATRDKLRRELNIEDKFVIGTVGRLTHQKNHKFLIEVFNEIYKKNKNAVLLLVGRGDLEKELMLQVERLQLTEAVKFLGIRNDINNVLQAMDVFLLPSIYEGLPVVIVEAQAAGLKCVVSDTVTREVKVTDLVDYISLKETYEKWAFKILELTRSYSRESTYEELKKEGYDIEQEARKMELYYIDI
ncbi:glycosyltransferase family 1 protein [Paenibacillus sp. FSL M7-0420]|uniref:glycosyltransferase family 1 protein n=1 Tax=Paenibacillus sp. FSL M7-0420 TaxID=2921609 RepID=UPI0030F87A8A